MDIVDLLTEFYGRVPPLAESAVEALDAEQLVWAPGPGANSIGWLIWHLTRVQDHHLSEVMETDQLWVSGEWAARCGLAPDPSNIGYGHDADDVRAVRPEGPKVLVDYLAAVHARTVAWCKGLVPSDLDRVIDHRWNPPVTLGVRLVSVADDCLQHAGQAAYVRGLLARAA
jgi:hypothetical protein